MVPRALASGKRAVHCVWVRGRSKVRSLLQSKVQYTVFNWKRVERWVHYPPSFKRCTTSPRGFLAYNNKEQNLAC